MFYENVILNQIYYIEKNLANVMSEEKISSETFHKIMKDNFNETLYLPKIFFNFLFS